MIISRTLDYRYSEAVLSSATLSPLKNEIIEVIQATNVPLLPPEKVKRRRRKPLQGDPRPRYFFLPVDQKTLNKHLDEAFSQAGWTPQPYIIDSASSKLRADFKKGKVQIEVQFGNMARWYTDVFKFQLSYSKDEIDVGVLVVPMKNFANLIDENVAYMERVERELPRAKMSLTLPIWVVGVEPAEHGAIEQRYDEAFQVFETATEDAIAKIPMSNRMAAEDADEVE